MQPSISCSEELWPIFQSYWVKCLMLSHFSNSGVQTQQDIRPRPEHFSFISKNDIQSYQGNLSQCVVLCFQVVWQPSHCCTLRWEPWLKWTPEISVIVSGSGRSRHSTWTALYPWLHYHVLRIFFGEMIKCVWLLLLYFSLSWKIIMIVFKVSLLLLLLDYSKLNKCKSQS